MEWVVSQKSPLNVVRDVSPLLPANDKCPTLFSKMVSVGHSVTPSLTMY